MHRHKIAVLERVQHIQSLAGFWPVFSSMPPINASALPA
jgi:hypothetical protein